MESLTDLNLLPIDVVTYGLPESDQIRIADLMRILPKEGNMVLDAGALTGFCSELLTHHFRIVMAVDLKKPDWKLPGVSTLQGDVTRLPFADETFDCVFCAEVLEHIHEVHKAACELTRVTKKYLVIGTPFDQDLRVGRMTCTHCGKVNPPYGHVNSFNETKLKNLFPELTPITTSLVYPLPASRTNALSAWLMELAGHPSGTYDQYQPCSYCGAKLTPPTQRSLVEKGCSFVAHRIDRLQNFFARPSPAWIHMVFRKEATSRR